MSQVEKGNMVASFPSCKREREAEAGPARPNRRQRATHSLTQAVQAEVQTR